MKFGITFFICFLIFIAWRFYEQRKSERMEKKISDDFWKKEEEANQTRKKDITNLSLLQVKKADLPKISSTDEAVLNYMEHLHQIVKNPMIDLSEYSNTDLKLAYGVANFKTLCEYDDNFNHFLITLSNLANSLMNVGLYEEAGNFFEFALHYGSKRLNDYTGLAEVFLKLNKPEQITALIRQLEDGCHPRKTTIINALEEIKNSHSQRK